MAGIFDDYINGLEGRSDINPLEVARELHELHLQETGTREAKINELKSVVAEKDNAISAKEAELTRQKAKNFDLAMQIPGPEQQTQTRPAEGEKPNGAQIRISDLFSDKVRARHFPNER